MKKLLQWLDKYLLSTWALFLLFFIPLYPKLPLFDVLPGYIVRVRLEDFAILIGVGLLIRELLIKRKSAQPSKANEKAKTAKAGFDLKRIPLLKPIALYLLVGLVSSLSAIFITKTVPLETIHVAKLLFHLVRRVEYFSLFFIFYFAFQKLPKKAKSLAFLPVIFVVLTVAVYGFGQKYLYWPVFLTMNREFSKGMKLYLTEHARVSSTFGGHYDLAAFLVIALPLILALFYSSTKKLVKFLFFLSFGVGFWLLILTASRTSFIAYLLSLPVLFIVLAFKKGIKWSLLRGVILFFVSILVMINLGDLSSRYVHFLKLTSFNEKYDFSRFLKPFKKTPPDGIAVVDVTDETPIEEKPEKAPPPDVYVNVPEKVTTVSAETKEVKVIYKPRTYSDNAYKYGLSVAIRLDALWPRAWEGFKRNPLLGSGYSTLTKVKLTDFTEAESTDNDYLRMLGETGLLGLVSFMAILLISLKIIVRNFRKSELPSVQFISAGFIAFILALMVNALYIDIFEASKVAYTLWGLLGIYMATQVKSFPKRKK